MGRFTYDEADQYGSSGGGGSFFSLKDDRDTAHVHLLGNDISDFYGYAVHRVQVGDKYRYVNCLRKHNDPIDTCPFCADSDKEISKVHAKLFIPLFNIDADEVQVWERGKSFFRDLSSYCTRYPNVVSCVTEIERLGAKGDTSTRYNLIKVDDSDATLEDFEEEIPEIIGGIVLDKTAEDMEYYLDRGEFPNESNDTSRRRSDKSESSAGRRSERSSRTRDEGDAPRRAYARRSSRRNTSDEDDH